MVGAVLRQARLTVAACVTGEWGRNASTPKPAGVGPARGRGTVVLAQARGIHARNPGAPLETIAPGLLGIRPGDPLAESRKLTRIAAVSYRPGKVQFLVRGVLDDETAAMTKPLRLSVATFPC